MNFENMYMLDIETTGVNPGCRVLSIGCCNFAETRQFYEKINIFSPGAEKLVDEPKTMEWWNTQSLIVRSEAFSGVKSLFDVAFVLNGWLSSDGVQDKTIWANGANFDFPVLRAAFRAVGAEPVWKYWDERCYRTLKGLYPGVMINRTDDLPAHNALADAIYQARHAVAIFSWLGLVEGLGGAAEGQDV